VRLFASCGLTAGVWMAGLARRLLLTPYTESTNVIAAFLARVGALPGLLFVPTWMFREFEAAN